jgi:DNA replication protein DnaC
VLKYTTREFAAVLRYLEDNLQSNTRFHLQANQRVLFTTAMDMLNQLLASQVDHSLVHKLKVYTEPTLLVVDELGYLSLDQQTSNLFYQVISIRRSHKRSTLITTNTAFSDCGNIL